MKLIVAASTILALFAGVASAASSQAHERPDAQATAIFSQQKVQVLAGSLHSNKELVRWGLKSSDLMAVTIYPSTGIVETKGGDN